MGVEKELYILYICTYTRLCRNPPLPHPLHQMHWPFAQLAPCEGFGVGVSLSRGVVCAGE